MQLNPRAQTSARNGAPYASRCPKCSAAPGAPCRNSQGQPLPGVHYQRDAARRRAIQAALDLYRPLARA